MNLNDVLDMPLTIKVAEVEKSAYYKLSENIDGWDKEIIQRMHEDVSYAADHPYEIKFKNMDRKYGYAVGSIAFTKLKGIYIPIVVRKYEMFPLDIIVVDEQARPLTHDTFNQVLAEKASLGTLVDPINTQQLVERQNAQANDLTDYPVAKYGFLQKANGDCNVMRKIAKANIEYLPKFKTNGTYEILKQAMHVPSKPDMVYERQKVAAKDITNSSVGPYVQIGTTSACKTASMDGVIHEGLLVTNVYDLDLEKQSFAMFIGNDGCYGYQDKFAGVILKKDVPVEKLASLKNDNYGIGDNICFVSKTASSCMSTIPVKVLSKSTVDGYTKISGYTVNSEPVEIYVTPNIRNITKIGHVYHIPSSKMEIQKLGSYKKFHWNLDTVRSQAIAKYASNTTKVVADGAMFTIENDYVEKRGTLNVEEAYDALKGYYTNPAEILKTASDKGSAIFTGVKYSLTKKAEPFSLGFNHEELFKIAASLVDPDSVDAVLSLGYVNESNMADFVEAIPLFEEVINKLAKMLLAIRLGMKGNEYSTRDAMRNIQTAVDGLKNIKG